MDDDEVIDRYQAVLEDAGLDPEVGVPTEGNITANGPDWSLQVVRNPGVLMTVQVLED